MQAAENKNQKTLTGFITPARLAVPGTASNALKRKASSPPAIETIEPENADCKAIAICLNSMSSQLSSITSTQACHTDLMTQHNERSIKNEKAIKSLENSSNDLQQARLNDRMEISGLEQLSPNSTREALKSHVLKLFNTLNIKVESSEIADVFSMTRKIKEEEKFFVTIIFMHPAIKTRVMIDKSKIKGDGNQSIFFNEVLTPFNRNLIYHARVQKKAGKFLKVGSLNGKIYVVKSTNSQKIFINTILEMETIARMSAEEVEQTLNVNDADKDD